jgi:hypothetical protein
VQCVWLALFLEDITHISLNVELGQVGPNYMRCFKEPGKTTPSPRAATCVPTLRERLVVCGREGGDGDKVSGCPHMG